MDQERTIFRTEALRHYGAIRKPAGMPRLAPPRALVWLWVGFGLLLVGAGLALTAAAALVG